MQLKDLSWLGQAFANKSFISPLGESKLSEFTAEDKLRLQELGIIKEDNTIKAQYYPLLEALAYADGFIDTTAKEEVFVYTGFSLEDLWEGANNVRENSQSLAFHVFLHNSGFLKFTMEQVEQTLTSLINKGLVQKDNDVYRPVGEALLFAGNFLVFENIIEVVVAQVCGNNLYRSGFVLLQAGPLDVLYMEKSRDNILMECLSPLKTEELMAAVLDSKPNIV
ncbi:MAG: hypothetical protein PWQ96_2169 [Clostridia bacterium]|nr:hypothetical protein [Clostridia bacterium]